MTPHERAEMIAALETIIKFEERTELRRVAMKRYFELTEKDESK